MPLTKPRVRAGKPPLTPLAHGNHDDAPARVWTEAFCVGNGRHGALVFGDPCDETVIVNHHALAWPDAAQPPAGDTPPLLAGRLDAVRDLLLAGEPEQALALMSRGWPEYHPRRFHPAFAVKVRMGAAAATAATGVTAATVASDRDRPGLRVPDDYLRTLDFRAGVATAAWRDEDGRTWRRTCFVSREHDVIVQRLTAPAESTLDVVVGHECRLDGAPPGLDARVRATVTSASGQALVTVRVRYPDPASPHGYAGVTRVFAGGGRCQAGAGGDVLVTGCRDLLLLTKVGDSQVAVEDLLAAVRAVPANYDDLVAGHVRLHEAAFGDVSLDLGAGSQDRALPAGALLARQAAAPDRPLPALLERLFDSGRYLLLSASGLLPPRLPGLWQGDWHSAWSGAITCNANLNLQLAGAVTTHVPAAVAAVADMVRDRLPDWRVNARRIFGTRGIAAPAHTDGCGGLSAHFAADYPHQAWTAGADWLLVPLLDYVAATGDEDFLRERVLPALTELAAFYEDFLRRTDSDGSVVFAPSYSPENAPGGRCPLAINATMDIAAARHALTAAAAATADADSARRWRALAARLPRYRVNADGALAEWAWPPAGTGAPPLPENYDHRHVSHLYPVWPLHEITAADTPDLAAAALRALALRGAENDSAHGYLHQALAAARLRDAGLAGRLLAALTGSGFFFRSLMSSHYPGQSVWNADAACALPGVLAELLVDSVPGRIDLLPAVPPSLPSGRLRGVRTIAGVTVADLWWDTGAQAVGAQATAAQAAAAPAAEAVLISARRQWVDVRFCRDAGAPARRVLLPAGQSVRVQPVQVHREAEIISRSASTPRGHSGEAGHGDTR